MEVVDLVWWPTVYIYLKPTPMDLDQGHGSQRDQPLKVGHCFTNIGRGEEVVVV